MQVSTIECLFACYYVSNARSLIHLRCYAMSQACFEHPFLPARAMYNSCLQNSCLQTCLSLRTQDILSCSKNQDHHPLRTWSCENVWPPEFSGSSVSSRWNSKHSLSDQSWDCSRSGVRTRLASLSAYEHSIDAQPLHWTRQSWTPKSRSPSPGLIIIRRSGVRRHQTYYRSGY